MLRRFLEHVDQDLLRNRVIVRLCTIRAAPLIKLREEDRAFAAGHGHFGRRADFGLADPEDFFCRRQCLTVRRLRTQQPEAARQTFTGKSHCQRSKLSNRHHSRFTVKPAYIAAAATNLPYPFFPMCICANQTRFCPQSHIDCRRMQIFGLDILQGCTILVLERLSDAIGHRQMRNVGWLSLNCASRRRIMAHRNNNPLTNDLRFTVEHREVHHCGITDRLCSFEVHYRVEKSSFYWNITRPKTGCGRFSTSCHHFGKELTLLVDSLERMALRKRTRFWGVIGGVIAGLVCLPMIVVVFVYDAAIAGVIGSWICVLFFLFGAGLLYAVFAVLYGSFLLIEKDADSWREADGFGLCTTHFVASVDALPCDNGNA